MRLSKFIETKLNCQYEDGKTFYEVIENEEATEIEGFLYCKKILRPKKNEVFLSMIKIALHKVNSITIQCDCEELELESLVEYFYAIPKVPCMAVKPEQLRLEHHRVFIQSTSQGSRCLKKGTKILYLKEVHHCININYMHTIIVQA